MKTPSINIRSRSRMFHWFAGVSLLAVTGLTQAQVIYSENWEAATSMATSGWAMLPGGATAIQLDTSTVPASNPTGGTKAATATLSTDSSGASLPTPVGTNLSVKFTTYMYDGTITRFFSAFRSYSDGTINGGLNQLIAIGKYNSVSGVGSANGELYDSTKYQGRILQPSASAGIFNLNLPGAPTRSTGWKKFDIIRGVNADSTITYNFYVNDILSRTFTITRTQALDAPNCLSLGSVGAGGTGGGTVWFDGLQILAGIPYISQQPQATTVTQNQPLTITAQVVGANEATNVMTYQWKKNGVNIPGATTLSISFPTSDPTNSGAYSIVASNLFGIATSTNATITVNPLILITTQPQGTRINLGEQADFSVIASGNGTLFYQWKKGGSNLVGKTDATLSIPNAQVSDRASYTVVITNDVGDPAVTSSAAVLQVNTAPQIFSGNTNIVLTSSTLDFAVPLTEDYSSAGVRFQDFESFNNGDNKMFVHPAFSGTTTNFLDTVLPEYAKVTNSFPAGHGGNRVLKASWGWSTSASGDWLRFTTGGSGASFSPIISATNLTLYFDIYSDKQVNMAYMVRETNPTGAYGANGGTSGGLEMVGISAVSPPVPNNSVPAGVWTKMSLNISTEMANFTVGSYSQGASGNNKVDSTTGKCVLESLLFTPVDITTPEVIYLDNFMVAPADPLVFTLDDGPAGATIDPVSGRISWLPPGLGVYNFTVSAKDTGSFITPDSGLTGTSSFTVTIVNAAPASTKLNYTYNKPNVSLSWTNSVFTLQTSGAVNGPWTDIPGATTGFTTNTASAAKFFRLKY